MRRPHPAAAAGERRWGPPRCCPKRQRPPPPQPTAGNDSKIWCFEFNDHSKTKLALEFIRCIGAALHSWLQGKERSQQLPRHLQEAAEQLLLGAHAVGGAAGSRAAGCPQRPFHCRASVSPASRCITTRLFGGGGGSALWKRLAGVGAAGRGRRHTADGEVSHPPRPPALSVNGREGQLLRGLARVWAAHTWALSTRPS